MADCALVLSNVLCFCINKYGKVSAKSLRNLNLSVSLMKVTACLVKVISN